MDKRTKIIIAVLVLLTTGAVFVYIGDNEDDGKGRKTRKGPGKERNGNDGIDAADEDEKRFKALISESSSKIPATEEGKQKRMAELVDLIESKSASSADRQQAMSFLMGLGNSGFDPAIVKFYEEVAKNPGFAIDNKLVLISAYFRNPRIEPFLRNLTEPTVNAGLRKEALKAYGVICENLADIPAKQRIFERVAWVAQFDIMEEIRLEGVTQAVNINKFTGIELLKKLILIEDERAKSLSQNYRQLLKKISPVKSNG